MARLPDYVHDDGHITHGGDRVTITIRADASGFLAFARNHGPAWDRLAELHRRLADIIAANPGIGHQLRHHMPEDPKLSTMHTAYDRRRRARRRRH